MPRITVLCVCVNGILLHPSSPPFNIRLVSFLPTHNASKLTLHKIYTKSYSIYLLDLCFECLRSFLPHLLSTYDYFHFYEPPTQANLHYTRYNKTKKTLSPCFECIRNIILSSSSPPFNIRLIPFYKPTTET